MRGSDDRNLILLYIFLAAGCVAIGTGITFALIALCAYYGINIMKNLWLLAIPPVASVTINVLLIELYKKLVKR